MREDFAASVRRDTIPMLIAAAENKLAVRVLPEEGRDGRTLRVLEISGPKREIPFSDSIRAEEVGSQQACLPVAPRIPMQPIETGEPARLAREREPRVGAQQIA